MAAAMGLSLVVGVALVETLQSFGYHQVGLKWPNDVYAQGAKLAGILVEMSATSGGSCHVVIGVGLNLLMPLQPVHGINQPWTALSAIRAESVPRNRLGAEFIRRLRLALQEFEAGGMAPFLARWNHLDVYRDRPVRLLLGEQEIRGVARGIDEQGGLVLETESGLQTYVGGEISLRAAN